jgi:pilus assembly protein CpaB
LKRSNRLMLVLGVVLALVAFGGVILFGSGSGNAQPATPPTVGVVTAAVDIPLGTALDATMLSIVQKPEAEALDTYRDPAVILGKVVRKSVNTGIALTPAAFESGSGVAAPDITANLEAGHVALAVSVDPVAGVGSLIQTGDHVDVILTMRDEDSRNPVVYPSTTDPELKRAKLEDDILNNTTVKVLVQNIQVVGTLSTAPADPNGSTTTPLGTMLVILSLTPQQVELVRFAQTDGNLVLTLRSPKDADVADATTTGITLRELVDKYGVLPPRLVETKVP